MCLTPKFISFVCLLFISIRQRKHLFFLSDERQVNYVIYTNTKEKNKDSRSVIVDSILRGNVPPLISPKVICQIHKVTSISIWRCHIETRIIILNSFLIGLVCLNQYSLIEDNLISNKIHNNYFKSM